MALHRSLLSLHAPPHCQLRDPLCLPRLRVRHIKSLTSTTCH